MTKKKATVRRKASSKKPRKAPVRRPKTTRSKKDRKPKARKVSYSGIKHPGSLTSLGYHIQEPIPKKDAALKKAVKKFGRNKVLQKLGDLVRLDHNKPVLRTKLKRDMEFVKKQPSEVRK